MNRAESIVELQQIFHHHPRWRAIELVADMLERLATERDTLRDAAPEAVQEDRDIVSFTGAKLYLTPQQSQVVQAVIVPGSAGPDEMNTLHGEQYGVDWTYEKSKTWMPMDSAPKDGIVFVIRFPLQGNVKKLCYWNTLHKLWEAHGYPIFPESQKCEWSLILPD